MTIPELFRGDPADYEIKNTKVSPMEVAMACPECREGRMRFTGDVRPTNDPANIHKCGKCGYACAIKGHKYPELRYLRAGKREA